MLTTVPLDANTVLTAVQAITFSWLWHTTRTVRVYEFTPKMVISTGREVHTGAPACLKDWAVLCDQGQSLPLGLRPSNVAITFHSCLWDVVT